MECMSEELEHIDQDRIDEIIWRHGDIKSPRQIAQMTGLKPEAVLKRKKELLEEVDDLTIAQTRQRVIIDLQSIARKTQEDYDAAPFEFKSGLMNSAVAAMKVVLQEMNRLEKADNTKIEKLNQMRVRELVNLVREVVDVSVTEIAQKHGLDDQELFETFNRHMIDAAQKRDMA